MEIPGAILGKHAADYLTRQQVELIVDWGALRLTRFDLAGARCTNFMAARRVIAFLNAFKIKSAADLFTRISPAMVVREPGIGPVAVAVVGAILEAADYGGPKPLTAWITHHKPDTQRREFVTVATMQRHATDRIALASERRATKSRARTRNRQAHELRVARTLKRH